MIITHKQNSSNQIVVPAERQCPQIFSAVTRKLQNTDIKLIEKFLTVSGKFIQPQKTDMKKYKGNRGIVLVLNEGL